MNVFTKNIDVEKIG